MKNNQPQNTMPLVEKDTNKRLTRSFDGKTDNFTDKKERNYYTKMLKAYLKGFTRFRVGTDEAGNGLYKNVEQSYMYV